MCRNPPAPTSSRPTATRAPSQIRSVWRSSWTIPWSIAYLTTSGALTAPTCQSRPETTAPITPARCSRTTVRRYRHAAPRRASRSPMRQSYRDMVDRLPIEERFFRPSVMGVVNVTPDSFSDGGVNFDPANAAAAARRMLREGAAIVDVGGESTRPGAEGVTADEELHRVAPVLERLG